MRILVAEDEHVSRLSLVRQLEKWGHEVAACEDGREALARFGEAAFDIVITDWDMPNLTGLELVRELRSAAKDRFVYVIMLTGRSEKADLVSGIEAGADDFLSKPFDREELRVRLLAGQRIVTLERTLTSRNAELQEAGERMRRDLAAASRVQRAMLPRGSLESPRVRASFLYAPTDELAGDALGFHLIADRYLVAYVLDVTGHGVPAALLAVTAMRALSPSADGSSLVYSPARAGGGGGAGGAVGATVQTPSSAMTGLNRRFSADNTDGRFLTMVLCILDTHDGVLRFTRAGHPVPIVARRGEALPVDGAGGFPIGLFDEAEYTTIETRLEPGDRVFLFSDGFSEQLDPSDRTQFGEARLCSALLQDRAEPIERAGARALEALSRWAGGSVFDDDVSLVAFEWLG